MDFVIDQVNHGMRFYEWALTRADDRVKDWPLMQGYGPTLAITMAYVLFSCFLGPFYMSNRKPYQLKTIMVVYNLSIMALNVYIFEELFTASYSAGYSYVCQPVNYSNDINELRIAKALYLYYISKMFEFMDTFIFVLRKKQRQISFLHVYHHATMFPIWWIGVKWVPGGQSFFGAMINSGIHVLMYMYYGLSGLGPVIQKYLWWKRYLTVIQLVQFIVGMLHAVQSLVFVCNFPEWMHWALVVYGISIFSLFMNFYIQSYVKVVNTAKADRNGVASDKKHRSKKIE